MAYREVRMIEVKEVLRLWMAAVPKARIAETLGLDRKTVRRYITLAAAQGLAPGRQGADALADEALTAVMAALTTGTGRPHGAGWAQCVEHRDFLEAHLKRVKLSKVRRLLLRRGVDVPYAVSRHLKFPTCRHLKLPTVTPGGRYGGSGQRSGRLVRASLFSGGNARGEARGGRGRARPVGARRAGGTVGE